MPQFHGKLNLYPKGMLRQATKSFSAGGLPNHSQTKGWENQMDKYASRSRVILAVVTATLLFTTAGPAQVPKSAWKRAAPFPEVSWFEMWTSVAGHDRA